MNCPVSNEPMLILELDEVEVDYCPVTGGIWLDGGELELLLDDVHATRGVLSSGRVISGTVETTLACPICKAAMVKWGIGENDPVISDRCPRGHGLWFDRGELRRVLSLAGDSEHVRRMVDFLNKMFPTASEIKAPEKA